MEDVVFLCAVKPKAKNANSVVVDPIEQVLGNPLLLQNIFQQADTSKTSLRTLRLVSKTWNNIILTLPSPRICLIVNNFRVRDSWMPHVFADFCNTMNAKVARRVGMVKRSELGNSSQTPSRSGQGVFDYQHGFRHESAGYVNFKHCLQTFSENIHTLDLAEVYVNIGFVQVIHQLLQQFCPNLNKIILTADSLTIARDSRYRPPHVSQTWRDQDFAGLTKTKDGHFPFLPKLKAIRFELLECVMPRATSGPMHTLYQELIYAAPNLLGLRQDFVAFPDCAGLVKLKSLCFKITLNSYDFNYITGDLQVPFDLTGLARMLTEVAKTTEYLKLQVIHRYCSRTNQPDCECRHQLQFVMPHMQNLKTFKCSDLDIFFGNPLGGDLSFLRRVNSGSLRCISLGKKPNGHVPGMASSINTICSISANQPISRTVDTVIVNGISLLRPLFQLNIPFPYISTLIINKHFQTMDEPDLSGTIVGACQLAKVLKLCLEFNLKSMTCDLPYPTKVDVFANVLHNFIPLFSGGRLKHLTINGTGMLMNMNAATDNQTIALFENAFLSMQNMECVNFVNSLANFPFDVTVRLYRFMQQHGLPIYIKRSQ